MLRFAPSPNGPLHLGHAVSAIANETMATTLSRPLTVRMEDIDRTRARPEHEAAILNDLAFLGIGWTGPMRRQSEHFALYTDTLDRLRRRGLLTPSFATRRELAEVAGPRDPDGAPLFPGDEAVLGAAEAARRRIKGEPATWRLRMAAALALTGEVAWTEVDAAGRHPVRVAGEPERWGDVVLARKGVPTSYHLAVVMDDAEQGISHVVRGADLRAATAVHRVLQQLLNLPEPLYHHHALVLGPDGRKLSKSAGSEGIAVMRARGMTAAEVRQAAAAAVAA